MQTSNEQGKNETQKTMGVLGQILEPQSASL